MATCESFIRINLAALTAVLFFLTFLLSIADANPVRPISSVAPYGKRFAASHLQPRDLNHGRRLLFLVEEPPLILAYHNGTIMTKTPQVPVYIIWYGSFNKGQLATLRSFLASFSSRQIQGQPSVRSWWNLMAGYEDKRGSGVKGYLLLKGETFVKARPRGPVLTNDNLENLVEDSLKTFPVDKNAIYFVFTAADVQVEDFCMNSCASHFFTRPEAQTKGQRLAYAWVGNSGKQCPGECAWPFARPEYGPPDAPLKAPNGDVGIDGMIINLGSMLAGVATNPFNNGFYQGDASAPLEAATACTGMYGPGSYPGYPGKLLKDKRTGASFNVWGINRRQFLLPALWNPHTFICTTP